MIHLLGWDPWFTTNKLIASTTPSIYVHVGAPTAAAARAAAKAMRDYSLTRATNHGLLLNVAHAPPVVPTPALHAASYQ